MVLVLNVLQDLSHNSQYMITVCRDNGGNIPSITKSGLAQIGGCVVVQIIPEIVKAFLNSSCQMKKMHARKTQTVV